jgi:integrase
MGTLRDGVMKRGKTWSYVIRVVNPDSGLSHPKWVGGFADEASAKGARDEARVAARRGEYVDRNAITVEAYLADWLAAHSLEVKPKTYEDYRSLVARYVAPRIGRMSLQAVRPVTLSALYQTLLKEGGKDGRPLSARTVSYVHAVLRKAFNDAVHTDQLIASNPAATAKRPRTTAIHVVKDVWDGPQLVRFLDAVATHRLYPLFHLAAYTGARRGELLYLRWDDVHLDGHDPFVRIRGSATIVAGHRVEGTTKSGRVRTVGLDAGTVSTLRAHAERQAKEREFVDQSWHETGHVFRMEIGTPLSPDIGGVVMRQTVRDLNDVDGAALLPAMRFHDLRHIHATLLLKGGVPVHVVAARLGHADPAITLRVYAHVLRDQASEVAQTFAEQVRPVSRPVSKTAEMEKHCDCR